jgi:hypothetical protein
MNKILDSFWRAAAYCLHPKIIFLSLLPLALLAGSALGLGYLLWQPAVDWTRATLESFTALDVVWNWLDGLGLGNIKVVLVPLLVIFAATPVLVIACLLLVALMMAPAIVRLVEARRFNGLEKKQGGSWWRSLVVSLGSTLIALLLLFLSIPFWLIPPVVLVVPPLIWGWLTYRVMTFDALATHASSEERRALISKHRGPLLVMGLISGYLGAAPGLVWASGAVFVVFFPILVPLAIWLYTLVFAFSSLWFTHYCLEALSAMRREVAAVPAPNAEASINAPLVIDAPTTTLSTSTTPVSLPPL